MLDREGYETGQKMLATTPKTVQYSRLNLSNI